MHHEANIKPTRILFSLLFTMLFVLFPPSISTQAQIVLIITVFTGAMWFTEAMPLHVTALLSTFLLIVFGDFAPKEAFAPYFAPTIVLFFGGFMIARAMQKHKLDKELAHRFLAKFGTDPGKFILGLMLITAFLSMWISNTASTAIMLPIALFVVTKSKLAPLRSNFAKAAILGIAFSATIGGMGTIVGSPPNGITVEDLAEKGITVTFLEWMYYGIPFVVLFLPVAWFILIRVYKPEIKKITAERKLPPWTNEHRLVLGVGVLTMLAWVTSFTHGVHSAAVAIGAVVLLYSLRLLDTDDVKKIQWPALLLFGGGLSLGVAIDTSGMGAWLGGILSGMVTGQSLFFLFLTIIAFAVVMTLSASNPATAALLVPIVIPLASMLGVDIKQLAILAGMGTSLDFLIPVGTPPSAIAYSSGHITVMDMLRVGVLLTIAGILLLTVLAWLYW
jgi:sodium-dependent dicarboxylate transporter 2/3/5